MFGKPSYSYNNYVPTNYSSSPVLNGSPSPCTSSALSTFVSLQEINELNQNQNILNTVYNQMQPAVTDLNGNSNLNNQNLNKSTSNYIVDNTNIAGNNTIGNLFMTRSPAAYGFGFSHFTNAANYLSAATVAAVAAAASHNNFTTQQNGITSTSNGIIHNQLMNSNHDKQSNSIQTNSIGNNFSYSNANNNFLVNNNNGNINIGNKQMNLTNESKLSLTPTSSSVSCPSSASSPNCLSESVESNLNHSNESVKNNRNSSNGNYWEQQIQPSNKNENVWSNEKKRNGSIFFLYQKFNYLIQYLIF